MIVFDLFLLALASMQPPAHSYQATPAPCTPTKSQTVCAYQSSANGVGVRMLLPDEKVACIRIEHRSPGSRVPLIINVAPRFPITEYKVPAREKGIYSFAVNYQVRGKLNGCPVPFNYPGGGFARFEKK